MAVVVVPAGFTGTADVAQTTTATLNRKRALNLMVDLRETSSETSNNFFINWREVKWLYFICRLWSRAAYISNHAFWWYSSASIYSDRHNFWMSRNVTQHKSKVRWGAEKPQIQHLWQKKWISIREENGSLEPPEDFRLSSGDTLVLNQMTNKNR